MLLVRDQDVCTEKTKTEKQNYQRKSMVKSLGRETYKEQNGMLQTCLKMNEERISRKVFSMKVKENARKRQEQQVRKDIPQKKGRLLEETDEEDQLWEDRSRGLIVIYLKWKHFGTTQKSNDIFSLQEGRSLARSNEEFNPRPFE